MIILEEDGGVDVSKVKIEVLIVFGCVIWIKFVLCFLGYFDFLVVL